ncbi:MAG TPA: glycoside hydrolase family 95 protein [Phnomibacter sp.]|nr:glycoside hydrolase family 95 protein [Phnomibacter sp.]
MKKVFGCILVLCCMGQTALVAQDLKLWYTKPAQQWTEALPLGNGRIGAMVFGGVDNDRIQYNEETLWSGEPRPYNKVGAYKYLDTIRQLLFAGKQKEAEALAGNEFMGLKSASGKREAWVEMVTANKQYAAYEWNDSKWPTMTVPSWDGWEKVGHEGLDGAVWLRTSFELTDISNDMQLDLNRIRDWDYTYVNGQLVASQQDAEGRKYKVAKNLLRKGKNTIAILVLNFFDKGGMYGFKDTVRHIGIYPVGQQASMISLNGQWKYFVANDNPPPVGVYQASYQPFGDLNIKFNHSAAAAKQYKRTLDIATAIATTSYSLNGVQYTREYFISQPNQAMVMQLRASQKGRISFSAALSSPHRNYTTENIKGDLVLSVKVNTGALHGKSYLRIVAKNGKVKFEQGQLVVANADEAVIYLTAGTNFKNYNDITADPVLPCTKALASLAGKTYAQIKAAHIKEYQQYFNTFSLNLGRSANESLPTDIRLEKFATSNDPAFVALYAQYGRYLLIASSRPGTRPANLQGIWNDMVNPPWGSKYTTNINAEMNYWPAELLNLSPMHQPLFQMINELAVTGKETAKEYYNAPGWVLHHNTDLWRGTAPINASNHGIWVTGAAWMTQHLWEHYLFTQDTQFLRKEAYPIMKEAAAFFNSYLIKDPVSGYLISTPSNSPEQGGLVAGPTMDHQIIRQLFENVITAGELLGVDAAFIKELKTKYPQIAPNKIGKHGQLQEWMKDVDDPKNNHRHISHLWAMYPGSEINWDETPELTQAAHQSLLFRGDEATGWSLGWKINCWARFKDGEHTFKMIQMLMTPAKSGAGSYPNLFDAHPPFQIDGNFGGAAGIGEMLVQSHTHYIDILPALPSAIPDGTVKGICARGGFVLNMQWKAGKLVQLQVLSKIGNDLPLRYNGKTVLLKTKAQTLYKLDGALNKL